MAEEKCCLCYTEVTSCTMKSKRIRVHGDAAKMSVDVINSGIAILWDLLPNDGNH